MSNEDGGGLVIVCRVRQCISSLIICPPNSLDGCRPLPRPCCAPLPRFLLLLLPRLRLRL